MIHLSLYLISPSKIILAPNLHLNLEPQHCKFAIVHILQVLSVIFIHNNLYMSFTSVSRGATLKLKCWFVRTLKETHCFRLV